MIRVAPFIPADAAAMAVNIAQSRDWPGQMTPHLMALSAKGRAFTLRCDGQVLCIVGLMEVHAQAATGWALMAEGCWGHMGDITRIVRTYLDDQHFRRIDMLVRADFAAGHRWARRLGFVREAVLRAWTPDGEDMVMHARIRGSQRMAHG